MRVILYLLLSVLLAGCATQAYRDTPQARFTGDIDVRWVKNDYFLFLPSRTNPFMLVLDNGKTICPGPMYTDGGSIPRILWSVKGYSPWGYAPAYIIHDWLFQAHHCGVMPDSQYTFDDSVKLMAAGLKAVMEQSPEVRNYFVFDSIVAAVGSPIAKRLWQDGTCNAPPLEMRALSQQAPPGDLLMTIRFK